MGALFLAVTVSVLIYLVAVALIPRQMLFGSSAYTHHMLSKLRQQNLERQGNQALPTTQAAMDDPSDSPLVRAFLLIPGMQRAVPRIQRADIWRNLDQFVLGCLLFFLFLLFVLARMGALALPLALGATWLGAWYFLVKRTDKRRRAFLEEFPDAIDSIVRSVRTGYPLSSAIDVIGDNMGPPVGAEFKRVSQEAAYGWTLNEALHRMAERIDEPDVHFFAVVLAVQQETGGNLAEVLSNLSSILRKRKQMRLKIRALSSEGRATMWILAALPVVLFGVLFFMAPQHLDPLFNTGAGNMLLAFVVGMVATGMFFAKQIINMDV